MAIASGFAHRLFVQVIFPGCKHCVCCRAPVLVALALIESGMKYEDAIQFIRQWVYKYSKQYTTNTLQ